VYSAAERVQTPTICPASQERAARQFLNLLRRNRGKPLVARRAAQPRNAQPCTKEDNSMKLLIIIVLMSLAGLAWVWPKKVGFKRTTARTWPAGRGRTSLKPKLAPRL
jgi:hypothetical protein